MPRRLLGFGAVAVLGLASLVFAATPAPRRPEADPNLEARIARTMPTGDENAYRQIKWYTDLAAAVRDAQSQNKPIFLWLMNGNPLCDT